MIQKKTGEQSREEAPRLFLVSPLLDDADSFVPLLEEAIGAGDIASLLVRLATRDPSLAKKIVRQIAETAQPAGVALIVEGDSQLASRAGADGVQVGGPAEADAIAGARKAGDDRIVGVAGLASRDDAMTAGELEVDYLMFGEPAPDGFIRPLDWRLERIAWWAEIFNVPCVAFAASLDEVRPLAKAGADFVALSDAVWAHEGGPGVAVAIAGQALAAAIETG